MLPEVDFALIVTVPSMLSRSKVERCLDACREREIPILGLIKNFSSFECPDCGSSHEIFPDRDHQFEGIPTLAEIPISREIAEERVINEFPTTKVLERVNNPVRLEKKEKPMSNLILKLLEALK